MQANSDNTRLDPKKLESDLRWESKKFTMQAIVAAAACVAVAFAIGNHFNSAPVVAAPPQIIYLVPGQAPAPTPR